MSSLVAIGTAVAEALRQESKWAYIFGVAAPETGEAFALVLPRADTPAMSVFLVEFAKTLPENEHAVMVLDQAGSHGANALEIPDKRHPGHAAAL